MNGKALGALASALVAFLVFGIFQWTSDEDPDPSAELSQADPSASASLNDPEPGPVPLESPSAEPTPGQTDAPQAIEGYPYGEVPTSGNVDVEQLEAPITDASVVAEQAITAYTSLTYTDPEPTAWIGRMRPFTTPGFQRSLERDFAGVDGGLEWDEMKAQQVETRTLINSTSISAFYDHNGADLVLVVDYTGSRRSDAQPVWSDGTGSLQKFVEMTLNDRGVWKVSDVRSTSDRTQ